MAVLIDARGLHKAYSGKVLMDDVSIAITDRMKLGLVGANGAGKSTLLKLIQGEEEPDLGQITTHNELRVGHLPQHDPFTEGESIADFLIRWSGKEPWTCGDGSMQALMRRASRCRFSPVGWLANAGQTLRGVAARA